MATSNFIKMVLKDYGLHTPTTKVELKAEYDRQRYQANKKRRQKAT